MKHRKRNSKSRYSGINVENPELNTAEKDLPSPSSTSKSDSSPIEDKVKSTFMSNGKLDVAKVKEFFSKGNSITDSITELLGDEADENEVKDLLSKHQGLISIADGMLKATRENRNDVRDLKKLNESVANMENYTDVELIGDLF